MRRKVPASLAIGSPPFLPPHVFPKEGVQCEFHLFFLPLSAGARPHLNHGQVELTNIFFLHSCKYVVLQIDAYNLIATLSEPKLSPHTWSRTWYHRRDPCPAMTRVHASVMGRGAMPSAWHPFGGGPKGCSIIVPYAFHCKSAIFVTCFKLNVQVTVTTLVIVS